MQLLFYFFLGAPQKSICAIKVLLIRYIITRTTGWVKKNGPPHLCAFSYICQPVMMIKTAGAQLCVHKETNEWSNSSEDLNGAEILHFWFREADLKHKTICPKNIQISAAIFTDKQKNCFFLLAIWYLMLKFKLTVHNWCFSRWKSADSQPDTTPCLSLLNCSIFRKLYIWGSLTKFSYVLNLLPETKIAISQPH